MVFGAWTATTATFVYALSNLNPTGKLFQFDTLQNCAVYQFLYNDMK